MSIERSKRAKQRRRQARAAEDRRWAQRSGPVSTAYRCQGCRVREAVHVLVIPFPEGEREVRACENCWRPLVRLVEREVGVVVGACSCPDCSPG